MDPLFAIVDPHLDRFVDELCQLCRIPSFGTNEPGMLEASAFLQRLLQAKGIDVQLVDVPGAHQYVLGRVAGKPGAPSVLWFNHYDIADYTNPVRDISSEFSGQVRDGKIYSRGVADDKATLLSRVHAVEALKLAYGELPVSVTFLMEGKKAVDSPALGTFLEGHHKQVESTFCFWEAGVKDDEDRPQLTLGHKGYLYLDLTLRALSRTMPSRTTVLPNAAWRMIWALNSLKGPDERILVEGFYDDVRPVSRDEEEILFRNLAAKTEDLLSYSGAHAFVKNLQGREVTRWLYTEPSMAVCGFDSGFAGEGQKLLTPDVAHAKLEVRLLPDQDPEDILRKLRRHLDSHGFRDVEMALLGSAQPYKVDLSERIVEVGRAAARRIYGMDPVITPVATGMGHRFHFKKWMDMPIAGFAIGYAGSQLETPEEHIRVLDYQQGIAHAAAILQEAGRIGTAKR